MATKIFVTVEDHGVVSGLQKITQDIVKVITAAEEKRAPERESELRGQIAVVVYNAYNPVQYQRNYNLWKGVSSLVASLPMEVDVILYNDTAKVLAQAVPSPNIYREGGRSKGNQFGESRIRVEVPIEIEEGTYPAGWSGYTAPRPAYGTYLALVADRIEGETLKVIQPLFRDFDTAALG